MTQWTIKSPPGSNRFSILKQDESQPAVLLGYISGEHYALTDVATFFEPGDIVVTNDAACIVSGICGEPNN